MNPRVFNQKVINIMSFIIYVAIGLLIGLVGEKFLKKKRISTFACVIPTVIGSVLGGYLPWSLNYNWDMSQFKIGLFMSILGGLFMIFLSYLLITRD